MSTATRQRITDPGVKRHIEYQMRETVERAWIGRATGDVLPTDTAVEPYVYTGTAPPMADRTGGDEHAEVKQYTFEIRNRKFSTGAIIPGDLIRRDQVMEATKIVDQLPARSVQHWEKLVLDVLEDAATNSIVGTNGEAFFGNGHTARRGAAQANTTTGTTPTDADTAGTIWKSAVDNMLQLLDDMGEPMHEDAAMFTLVVPFNLYGYFWQSLTKDIITVGGNAVTNPLLGYGTNEEFKIQLVSSVRMANATNYPTLSDSVLLFRDDAPGKAVIRQEEYQKLVSYTGDDTWSKDNDGAWKYRIEASRAAGLGSWQNVYLVDMT